MPQIPALKVPFNVNNEECLRWNATCPQRPSPSTGLQKEGHRASPFNENVIRSRWALGTERRLRQTQRSAVTEGKPMTSRRIPVSSLKKQPCTAAVKTDCLIQRMNESLRQQSVTSTETASLMLPVSQAALVRVC